MTVSILLVRALLEAVRAAGVPREDLLSAVRFDAARLDDVEGRLELEELDRLQEAALDLTGDPALGLHMGERASAPAYDMVAYLTSHAGTLREGIDSYLRFRRILSEGPESSLEEEGDLATLVLPFGGAPEARCTRLRAELALTGFVRLLRHFCGDDASPREVWFSHAAPTHRAEYARIFGGAERFLQPITGIVFERAMLEQELLHKNPRLHAILTGEAERKLSRLTNGVRHSDRLREFLVTKVPAERPDMSTVARQLGMSVRSLRRRLSEEGTSYAGLLEAAHAEVAKRLLDDPGRSIYETAYDMGFSDPSAFHRAFKRWTGMTPRQYREAAH